MIYYDIQHYGGVERLNWLLQHIQHTSNHINISYDGDLSILKKLLEKHSNIAGSLSYRSSIPVTWCGPSQVIQMKNSLLDAMDTTNWDYYVNLSGVDIPLISQQRLIDKLIFEKDHNNKTSFCFGFEPKREPYWLAQSTRFERIERQYSRLQIVCDEKVNEALDGGELDPIKNIMQRRALYCEEIGNKKLFVRSLTSKEIKERSEFWTQNRYLVGRTWTILHRKQIEWLLGSETFETIYHHLLKTFEPDETLFPSVLFSDQNPYLSELSKDNLRYGLGTPKNISKADLNSVLNSGACFARKICKSVTEKDLELVSHAITS